MQSRGRAPNEIPLIGRQQAIVARQNDLWIIGDCERDQVVQADRLKDSVDFVIAVGALAEDAQAEIDLGEGWKRDGVKHRKKRPKRATRSLRCEVRAADERK